MANLEELKKKILNLTAGKFNLYYTDFINPKTKLIARWNSDDPEGFISIAEKLGIELLYFHALELEDDPEHRLETATIQLGYIYNDVFHVYTVQADWFEQFIKRTQEDEYSIENKPVDELVNEMIKFIEQKYTDIPDKEITLELSLREPENRFWREKGLPQTYDRKTSTKIQIVHGKVLDYFIDRIKERNQKIINKFKTEPVEILVEEMMKMIGASYGNSFDDEERFRSQVYSLYREFWAKKGVDLVSDPEVLLKEHSIEGIVEDRFIKIIHDRIGDKEKKLITNLIDECVVWCREHKLLSLTKDNVKVFLRDKRVHLSTVGADTLYLDVNNKLKTSVPKSE